MHRKARTPTYAKLSEVEANFKRLADLGLFVQVSEMDVKLRVPQIQAYVDMATACLASFNCISFSVWNPNDADSWIIWSAPGFGSATPAIGEEYTLKPVNL